MKRIKTLAAPLSAAICIALAGCNATLPQMAQTGADIAAAAGYNNQATLIRAVKETLELGSGRAADLLGQPGGYSQSGYRIQLPANIQPYANSLRQLGLGKQLDQVEKLMNQGAEKAAGEAKTLFVQAARNMSVSDALGIVRGGNTAATDYFRQQTEASLRQRYQPIIKQSLQQIGFYNQYQQLLTTYQALPLANKPDLDLENYVLNKSMDALFTQVAAEEKAIRKDPVGQGSQLIASVLAAPK